MSQADELLFLLKLHEGQWFSHAALVRRMNIRHQSVFQICRRLAMNGKIHRERKGHEWWICYGDPRYPIPEEPRLVPIAFDWISDSKLRDVVRSDWEEANKCLKAGTWKAAVILSGACLEGVLVGAVQNREAEARKWLPDDLKGFAVYALPLRQLVRIAEKFGLLNSRSADFLVKSRNIVHPGNSAADPTPISKAEAQADIALLGECLRRTAALFRVS